MGKGVEFCHLKVFPIYTIFFTIQGLKTKNTLRCTKTLHDKVVSLQSLGVARGTLKGISEGRPSCKGPTAQTPPAQDRRVAAGVTATTTFSCV